MNFFLNWHFIPVSCCVGPCVASNSRAGSTRAGKHGWHERKIFSNTRTNTKTSASTSTIVHRLIIRQIQRQIQI